MDRNIRSLTSFRALAAGLVLVFHLVGEDSLPGPLFVLKFGWAGVSLFFALSGFLFTYLYLDAFASGTQSLRAYFIKRLFRVYPLYLFLLAVTVVTTQMTDWKDILAHVTMTHAFFLRYRMMMNPPAWTLSVEESFYIIIPLLLVIIGQTQRALRLNRRVAVVSLQLLALYGMCALSWNICEFVVSRKLAVLGWTDSDLWSVTLFGRFSDFAYGMAAGLIALHFPGSFVFRNRIASTLLFILGCAVFVSASRWMDVRGGVSAAANDPDFTANGRNFGLAGGLLVIGLCGNSIFKPVFDNRVSEYLGRISFALYLVQFSAIGPVLRPALAILGVCRKHLSSEWEAVAATCVLTCALAALLHHTVEVPCHRWLTKRYLAKSQILARATASVDAPPATA